MLRSASITILAFIGIAQAHMQLAYPPPFNATNNPHRTTAPDTELDFPHNCCGKQTPFPCRGYLKLLGTPDGAPTASWPAGSAQQWAVSGPAPFGGNHYGGSCQIGFSVDQGQTFRVVTSYEGACPHRNGGTAENSQRFNFTVPSDLPTRDVLFAWTWYNREQEFFMNCAAVTITDAQVPPGSASSSGEPVPRSTIAVQSPSAIQSSVTTLSTQTLTNAAVTSVSSMCSHSSTPSTVSAGTHEIHGCSCRCGNYTTHPDGSISVGKCSCSCPTTVNKRDLYHPENSVQLPLHEHEDHAPVSDHFATGAKAKRNSFIAFDSRPEMFYADKNNGCFTPKTTMELEYPDPGPDVVFGDGQYPLAPPYGTCS